MKDRILGIDLGVDTPEENTQKMVENKTLSLGAIEIYSDLYHKLYRATMDGKNDLANQLKEEIENLSRK